MRRVRVTITRVLPALFVMVLCAPGACPAYPWGLPDEQAGTAGIVSQRDIVVLASFGLFGPADKVEPVYGDFPEDEETIPEQAPADSDNDGVPDFRDKCPGTPPGVEVDKDGCPKRSAVDGDGDGDGVPDSKDKCPHTPKYVPVDIYGCPKPEKAVITSRGTYDFGTIHFDFNKSVIKPVSFPLLNNVAEHLSTYPDVKLEIQGHTDSVGSAAYNRKLSGARARAVKVYLARKGISPSRLKAKGFGKSSPIAPNTTGAGRAKNRRTEFMPIW